MNKQFRFAIMAGAAVALFVQVPAPAWAQESNLEQEARAVRERLRFVRQMEGWLKAAEEARQRGACQTVVSFQAQFQALSPPPGSGIEFVADFQRRMWEIALRDCPPGSGKPSVAPPPPPPAPEPTPAPPVVLPVPPEPVGSVGAPGGTTQPPTGTGEAPPKGLPPAGGAAPKPTGGEPTGTEPFESILDHVDEVDRAEWERRKAEREARIKSEATPSSTGAATPPRSQAQGLSTAEQQSLAAKLEEAQTAEQTVRDLEDDWLSWESRVSIAKRFRETLINDKKFPAEAIQRWVDRLDEVLEKAPPEAKAAPSPQTSVPNLSPFAREVLAAHNVARAAVGAPPLKWNPALEASATAHAGKMARAGEIVHAPRAGRGIERENLLKTPVGYSINQMMQRWTGESRYFVPGIYPNICTGGWSKCAHYTQIIWPTTTDLGCGLVPSGGSNWMVCRYSPGGNKDGKPVG